MDALYFRVSSERQTTENQFEDVLQVAECDGSAGRDWTEIRGMLSACVVEEQVPTPNAGTRPVYRVRPEIVEHLTGHCIYVEQGRSGRPPADARCSSG